MTHRQLKSLFALASLLLVLILLYLDLEQTSPGPLSTTHSQAAELVGSEGCQGCHGSWGQSFAKACGDCHADVAKDLDTGAGLHGTLVAGGASVEGQDCGTCHREHHGAELALVTALSFQRAGVPDPERYDHRTLGFELGGRHVELTCDACHENADVEILKPGEQRFAGLEQRCDACHDDPHAGAMVRGCADCHGQSSPFAELATFEHGSGFPLVGGHAGVSCAACHEPGSAHAVESLGSAQAPPAARACGACHASPHAQAFLSESAALLSAADDETCASCHNVEDSGFEASALDADWHAATGFMLERPHQGLTCEACHASGGSFAERFPGRLADDCASCHQDPHAGQFDDLVSGESSVGCVACHERDHFRPSAFDLEAHAGCAFPLDGSHEAVSCAACHALNASEVRLFRGTSHACETCHADAHEETFTAASGCADCHTTESFASVHDFDHSRWTGFPLDGAHARADCASCHPRAHRADTLGRRFGRVSAAFGEPETACATCHMDPHRGAFDAAGDVAEGCAQCHTAEAFDVVGDFAHGHWTGFDLTGAHELAGCATCHDRDQSTPNGSAGIERAQGFALPVADTDCAACHFDVHAGFFDRDGLPDQVAGQTGCARCHTTTSFAGLASETALRSSFDHELWTGYPLAGGHARTACESCHAGSPDASGRRFGRVPGTACADCHADPHVGQFVRAGRTDCARCHTVAADFSALTFDHARHSRFALDKQHEKLACAACHVPAKLVDGTTAVRYRPLGTECGDCHTKGDRR